MRRHLTYANVVATLALVVAVGGGSTAVAISVKEGAEELGDEQIDQGRNDQVQGHGDRLSDQCRHATDRSPSPGSETVTELRSRGEAPGRRRNREQWRAGGGHVGW